MLPEIQSISIRNKYKNEQNVSSKEAEKKPFISPNCKLFVNSVHILMTFDIKNYNRISFKKKTICKLKFCKDFFNVSLGFSHFILPCLITCNLCFTAMMWCSLQDQKKYLKSLRNLIPM